MANNNSRTNTVNTIKATATNNNKTHMVLPRVVRHQATSEDREDQAAMDNNHISSTNIKGKVNMVMAASNNKDNMEEGTHNRRLNTTSMEVVHLRHRWVRTQTISMVVAMVSSKVAAMAARDLAGE